MAFQTGLSGLDAASQSLDIIGNNVSNASTAGFKESRALFADVYANSLGGAGSGPVGIGTKVANVQQEFTQGNITTTSNPLDIAVNGNGFFQVQNNGAIYYTRNGQFHQDNAGYIVTADDQQVMGYGVDASGNIIASTPVPLQISNSQLAPSVTTSFKANLNLNSAETPPATAIFNPADPTSYNESTSGTVYDSLGNSHDMTLYFVKTAVAGQWALHGTVDGTAVANVNLGAGAGNPVNLTFNSSGVLTTAMPVNPVALTIGGGAASPVSFSLDFTGSTQFGSPYAVNSLSQDGYTSGRLSGFNVSGNGVIVGSYTNGQSKNLGQIALASFADPEGLQPQGNNNWAQTAASGLPIVGAPGTGGLGALQSAAVEQSNVDLTSELVNMITAQRVYQANAQSIKAQDAILQTLVNLN
jgi:flagellar hook protein FlgE